MSGCNMKSKVTSGANVGFVTTGRRSCQSRWQEQDDGETDELSSFLELKVTLVTSEDEELCCCLCVWRGTVLPRSVIINQRLFLDKDVYLYCTYKLCFLRPPSELLDCSTLDFPPFVSSQFVDLVVGACLHSSPSSTHSPAF